MSLNPGKLNRRVTLQVYEGTTSATGGVVESWVMWRNRIPCERVEHTGRAFRAAGVGHAEVSHVLRIRYVKDFDPVARRFRALFDNAQHDVVAVLEEGNREAQLLTLVRTEGAPQ